MWPGPALGERPMRNTLSPPVNDHLPSRCEKNESGGEENLQGRLIVARLGAVLSFLSCLPGIERRPLLCLPYRAAGAVEVL